MVSRLWTAMMILVVALAQSPAQVNQPRPTTIKKKDGQVVQGLIQGVLVQAESRPAKTESSAGYGGLYYIAKGEQVELIDDEGIHYRSGTRLRYVLIGQKERIDDTEAVRLAIDFEKSFTAMFEYATSHGMASVKSDVIDMKTPAKLKLMGEYRREGTTDRIIPALEVITATGKIAIPVGDIAQFKPGPAEP